MGSGLGEGPNEDRVGTAGGGDSQEKSFGAVRQTVGSDTRLGGCPVEVGSGVEGIKVSGRRVGWNILGKPLKVGGQAPGRLPAL